MYSPEGIFPLGITPPSRPAAKLNKKVFRPECTVCVQSRKIFFTPEQPLHPDLAQILDIFRYIGKVYILEIEADLAD